MSLKSSRESPDFIFTLLSIKEKLLFCSAIPQSVGEQAGHRTLLT
jgi:hypothetical protein